MKRQACYVDAKSIDLGVLLEEWRWLIGPGKFTLIQATALGDLFLKSDPGDVYFLNTMEGQFTRVADSEDDLSRKLDDRASRDRWLMPHLVELAQLEGITLSAGQCYGWRIPPVMGGEMDETNLESTELVVHHSTLGQLFRQTRQGSTSSKS